MRAVYYDRQGAANDVLKFGDLPQPTVAAGQVLVRVHVSGINPSDSKHRTGFVSKMAYERIIPHQDGAGVIEAVGAGVSASRIGERVWIFEAQTHRAYGTAAEFVVVPSENAVPLPDRTSFEIGATLGIPALTAHRCLFAHGALRGRRVLVQGGAGAVGVAAILLAKQAGAWVAATVRRPEQEGIARQVGADLVLNLKSGRDVISELKTETEGKGVDRIVEVDLADNLELDRACLANGGIISAYAARDRDAQAPFPIIPSMIANITVSFVYLYTLPFAAKKQAISDITECLRANVYNPAIGLVLPLERTADGHVAVESGEVLGKVLIRIIGE